MTELLDAVKRNDINSVEKLIKKGTDINAKDENGDAPLVQAAYLGFDTIVRLLLEAGADVEAVDPGMKATALHAAAYAGRTEAARQLINYHIDIDKQGPYNGYTALHDAIWQNHIETAKLIINSGANLNLKNHAGQTPLNFARSKNLHDLADLIEQKIRKNL